MRYLADVFADYRMWARPLKFVAGQGTQQLDVADVVAIYGDDIVYGVVFETLGEYYNVIYLTTELILGGDGYKISLNHLVDSAKVTPINFYIKANYCEVVRKLSEDEFAKVVDSFKKLSNKHFGKIWKKNYLFETKRLQLFYDMFLSEIIDR